MNTADELRKNIAEAQALLARLEKRPIEPDGSDFAVITFEVQFKGSADYVSGKVYTFAALRADGRWYLTGKHPIRSFSWDEMFSHFEARGEVSRVQTANGWTPIFPAVSNDLHEAVRSDAINGRRMQAIRKLRTGTGMGLREAKNYLDQFSDYGF